VISENAQTEQVIKDMAKKLIFQDGILKATTQQIADEAGVNRALIHYYFRSREQLLDTLLTEAITERRTRLREIFNAPNDSFKLKISKVLDLLMAHAADYPYLENFIVSEVAHQPDKVKVFCFKDKDKNDSIFRAQLQEEIEKGTLQPITKEHFMINLISMCHYPVLSKPILQTIHGMSEPEYKRFMQERKRVIYRTIFNEDVPDTDHR